MNSHRVLYISAESNQISGGTAVMKRNLDLLKKVPNVAVYEYRVPMQSKILAFFSCLFGGNFILSGRNEKMILNKIRSEQFDCVFQEGTTSGHLAESLHKNGVKLVVFAHNVEKLLYQERYRSYKYNVLEALKYWSIKSNEKKSVAFADILIALTKRDSNNFVTYYGRKADVVMPISFEAREIKKLCPTKNQEYLLFVGSNFFPNVEGMNWFIKNVIPFVNINVKIVGSCCNGIIPPPENLSSKIELLGIVENLNDLYLNAMGVIAPIFKGSGMKTKTIEAMSYGKTIFGTDECFQGIECDYNKIGGLCNTANEFIEKINDYSGGPYNEYTKSLFDNYYSNEAVQEKFNNIFK